MRKLQWLEIQNYRGIKQAKFENFGDINMIVGRNNTGKSTILESVYLNITAHDRDLVGNVPIRLIFRRRGILRSREKSLERDDIFRYLGYIFYQGNAEIEAKFNSNLGEYSLKVLKEKIPDDTLELVKSYLERKRRLLEIEIGDLLFVVVDNLQRPVMIAFEVIFEGKSEYMIQFILPYHPVFKEKLPLKQERRNVIVVDSHLLLNYDVFEGSAIKAALMRIERYARINKDKLIKFLSDQLEEDIVTVESKLFDVYAITKDDRSIPFSLLGDGTKVSLIYFYALSLKNSYILFEEPENHLHPKLISKCADLMVKSSKRNQIFITTHNLELLQVILEKAKEYNVNLKIYSTTCLRDGILKCESYDLDEAYTAVNKIGVDLR